MNLNCKRMFWFLLSLEGGNVMKTDVMSTLPKQDEYNKLFY